MKVYSHSSQSLHALFFTRRVFALDHSHKGEGRGAIRSPASSAASHFQWSTNVRNSFFHFTTSIFPYAVAISLTTRADDKTAKDFNITPGAVLHLVLALRGGRS